MKNRIIFRADGNSQIGLGHVMRLLALAEMLQPEFALYFAIQAPSPSLTELITNQNISLISLPAEDNYLQEACWLRDNILLPLDVLVLDGYHFNTTYQSTLRPKVARLFCLDDLHAFSFDADVVVNPAGGVTESLYKLRPGTQFFAGPDYALLRQPFLTAARTHRKLEKVKRVFVNLGGADPQNHTLWVLQEIRKAGSPLQLEVVIGSAYTHLPELEAFINKGGEQTIHLHQNLSAEGMCTLMQGCDAAICPPSTVAYEWCCISGPLFLIRTADNQKDLAHFLLNEPLALPFNKFLESINNPEWLTQMNGMVEQQRKYFWGQSQQKWRELFYKQVYPAWLTFRLVQLTDSDILFSWINDPDVRRFSLNPAAVPLDIHLSWFSKKIQEENSFIFIAELGEEPIGMIRFDISGTEALISYLLDKDYRGKGLGTPLLIKGMAAFKMVALGKADKITGLVQKQNIASVKAFEKAGFIKEHYNSSRHPSLIKFSQTILD